MLRRLVSLGQPASESDEPMSRSTEDAAQSPDSSRGTGGLASVFKNLTGARLTKSPPPVQKLSISSAAPSPAQLTTNPANAHASIVAAQPSPHAGALEQLRNGTPNERVTAAASLRIAIATSPLASVLDIWYAGKDLIEPGKPHAARVAGWELVTECVKHRECTDLERREYFQTLSAPANPEDFHLQLAALEDLTRNGRDLSGFEYDAIPLLSNWLQEKFQAVKDAKEAAKEARKNLSRSTSRATKAKATVSGEEKNFSRLFDFVLEVVKFNFKVTDDNSAGQLIERLLDICMATGSEEDLKSCIAVFNAIVTFGMIPSANLARCVNVLSSIYSMVPNLAKAAWQVLSNISRSHHGTAMVQVLLGVIQSYTADSHSEPPRDQRDVRGALEVLQKLVWKPSSQGYPVVPLNPLVEGLVNIVDNKPTPKTCSALLQLIGSLFDDGSGTLNPVMEDEEWAAILDVAAECVRKGLGGPGRKQSRPTPPAADGPEREDPILAQLGHLIARLEQLLVAFPAEFVQRHDCIVFFIKMHDLVPDSAASLVLDYFAEFHCCFPSDLEWEGNLRLVLDSYFRDRRRSGLVRSRALHAITEVIDILEIMEADAGGYSAPGLTKALLDGLDEEGDTMILQDIVSYVVSTGPSADTELFEHIMNSFKAVVSKDKSRSPASPLSTSTAANTPFRSMENLPLAGQASRSASDLVTRGFVHMFLRSMDTDVWKATKLFNAMVHIARSRNCETDARLTAMKLLFRLRSDWEDRVFVTTFTESEALAAMLFRTEASLSKKLADEAQHARQPRSEQGTRPGRAISFGQGPPPHERATTSRSASGAGAAGASPLLSYHRMWSLPDPDALPEKPSATASPVLFSHAPRPSAESPEPAPALNTASWLEAIATILRTGSDWEVYSFIVVHLSSQLTNHALFKDATSQIQQLRGILCDKIRNKSFQEPPVATLLRKAEVAVCLYHSLITITSYHHHFQKNEEDEIVQTFMQGLSDKSAKCCIHALSICAHELPLSTSKCLVAILQRMSQIITRQGVAMHILEFLACLSRLPELYSNFREDEYRIVFGICCRYLQDARAKRSSGRQGSNGSESQAPVAPGQLSEASGQLNSADDLPQYVYELAHHVITFWFLAVKLPDRANHVPWIAKNLFSDADGGPGEEQAQITIDFMSRVAYSEVDESLEDPLFTQERFGEIRERRWIVGNSIVSIKQATKNGWAHITKRQPSGTSCFVVRESVKPLPPHQVRPEAAEGNREGHTMLESAAFPSHVMVQLLSALPQPHNPSLRPIPLPDDSSVSRRINMFDMNSPVDGHKIGVIYIGEGQTAEAEILGNVSGSRDYVEFLGGLGSLTKLKGAKFNTQGLDRQYDTDGLYTFCWRDRVTEIVFHVTTQMPTNLEHDPACNHKKKHIGNDFVNIIFNDSGLPFKFDTFASEFNYVNIVIAPVSRASFVASRERAAQMATAKEGSTGGVGVGGGGGEAEGESTGSSHHHHHHHNVPFYKVQVMSKAGFPEISPAAQTKMISLKTLPEFVRLVALNASVFSHVWSTRTIGEHVSTWRNRLREIAHMRKLYGPAKATAPSPSPPSTAATGSGMGMSNGNSASAASGTSTSQQVAAGGVGLVGGGGGGGAGGVGGPSSISNLDVSRPASSMRDSLSSLRRSSVATFFTTASDQALNSHRSSMISSATAADGADITPTQSHGHDAVADSLDFSKWA